MTFLPGSIPESKDVPASLQEHFPMSSSATEDAFEKKKKTTHPQLPLLTGSLDDAGDELNDGCWL